MTPDTQPPEPRREPDALHLRFGASELILGLVALTMLAHALRLLARHTFWYDEAMLLTNIADGTFGELFGPLPFYDQAAPQLYLLVLKALHAVFGTHESALRLPSWLAAAAALWIMAKKMPGLTALERAAATAVLAGGITFAYLTTEAKQYTFEILGACALMAWLHDPGRSPRAQLLRLGVLLIAMLGTSTFPLAAFAVGAAVLLQGIRTPVDVVRKIPIGLMAGGWIFAAAGLIYVAYYLAHIRPAYEALLRNFGYTYQGFGFARDASYPVWLTGNLWTIAESHYGILAIPILAAAVLGAWWMRGRGLPYRSQAAALLAAMITLNMLGIYPLLPARFSIFVVPWLAVFAGVGMAAVLERINDQGLRIIAAAGAALLVLMPAGIYIATPRAYQAQQAIAYLKAARATPVMVTVSAQPVFDLYLQTPATHAGDRCRAPSVLGYTHRCRALKTDSDGVFQGAATKWYLLNYAAIIGRGVAPIGFPGRDPQAFAASYLDWLESQIPAGKPVLILTAPQTRSDTDGDPWQARLRSRGTVERVIDERRQPTDPRSGQIDRVQR